MESKNTFWVARDKYTLTAFEREPIKSDNLFFSGYCALDKWSTFDLPYFLLPEITFENSPQKVAIIPFEESEKSTLPVKWEYGRLPEIDVQEIDKILAELVENGWEVVSIIRDPYELEKLTIISKRQKK